MKPAPIFAGRLIKEKNVDLLIKAVALLKADFPQIRCCIVGDGPEKAGLVELAENTEVYGNIEFAGFQEYWILIEKIKASKCLCCLQVGKDLGWLLLRPLPAGYL